MLGRTALAQRFGGDTTRGLEAARDVAVAELGREPSAGSERRATRAERRGDVEDRHELREDARRHGMGGGAAGGVAVGDRRTRAEGGGRTRAPPLPSRGRRARRRAGVDRLDVDA